MGDKPSYREWASRMLGIGKKGAKAEETQAPPPSTVTFTKNLVLVIDDSEIDRMILEDLLDNAGYDVMLAEDGDSGLELFREHLPILTITDMIMPGKKGDQVIMQALDLYPDARFIAMSAGGGLGPDVALVVAKTLSAISNVITISKPFEKEQMLAA